jgi:hypothetical protein
MVAGDTTARMNMTTAIITTAVGMIGTITTITGKSMPQRVMRALRLLMPLQAQGENPQSILVQ